MRIIVTLTSMLIVCGCSSMLVGGSGSSGGSLGADQRSATQIATDNDITAAIVNRYNADADISQYDIGVRTDHNNVTLTGTVRDFDDRDRAARMASDIAGVRRLDNQITVNSRM